MLMFCSLFLIQTINAIEIFVRLMAISLLERTNKKIVNWEFIPSSRIDILSQIGESKENLNRASVNLTTRQFFPVASYLELEEELGSRLITSPSTIPFAWGREPVKSQGSGICASSTEHATAVTAEGKENPKGTAV
ncbi:hypothetical protein LXL04_019258 [Taraxacum kok-saghyz]